ncbi:hypothetical protein LTR95_010910 [Oleoguttula sp. CCFEE 5521]
MTQTRETNSSLVIFNLVFIANTTNVKYHNSQDPSPQVYLSTPLPPTVGSTYSYRPATTRRRPTVSTATMPFPLTMQQLDIFTTPLQLDAATENVLSSFALLGLLAYFSIAFQRVLEPERKASSDDKGSRMWYSSLDSV